MGAPRVTQIKAGDLRGTLYDFDLGDVLPVHSHDASTNHTTTIARGSVRLLGAPEFAGQVLKAGAYIDWPIGVEHGFEALEPETRIIQHRRMMDARQ